MTTDRPPPVQQGQADGLCGFYSLLNFLRHCAEIAEDSQEKTDREAFRILIEAMEQLSFLSASHLHDGLEGYKLGKIFNQVCLNYRIAFTAVPFKAVAEISNEDDFFTVFSVVHSQGGAVIAHMSEKDHWVLAYSMDDRHVLIDDSSLSDPDKSDDAVWPQFKISRRSNRSYGLHTGIGLAIVPLSSSLADLK